MFVSPQYLLRYSFAQSVNSNPFGPSTYPGHAEKATYLALGGARLLTYNLTAGVAPSVDEATGTVKFDNFGLKNETDTSIVDDGDRSLSGYAYAEQVLLKLAVLAQWPNDTPLPWCTPARDVGTYHQLAFPALYVDAPGLPDKFELQDCSKWPLVGWGPVRAPANPVPPTTGANVVQGMQTSWAAIAANTGFYRTSAGTGFANYPSLIASAVDAAVDTVTSAASTLIEDYTTAQLAMTDFTLTAAGAVIAMSLTLVSLIAAYIAREELLVFFLRTRYFSMAGAKAVGIVVTLFAVITYPVTIVIEELGARDDNPDGSVSAMQWVQGSAHGVGEYKVRQA